METRETLSHYEFCEVPKDEARDLIIANHYSGKWATAFGTHNYGLRDETGKLLAVAAYGYPRNVKSYKRLANVTQAQFIELNRLWAADSLGKNAETWIMAESHKRLLTDHGVTLVQSFADGRLGVGTIYQAAGFGYYGNSVTRFHSAPDGAIYHDTKMTNTPFRGIVTGNAMHARGELTTFTVNTYRYLKPLTRHAARNILLTSKPYPKERLGTTTIPNYTPPVGQVVRGYAKALAQGMAEAKDLAPYIDTLGATPDDVDRAVANRWILLDCEKHGVDPNALRLAMNARAHTLTA